MQLIIDYRESALIKACNDAKVQFKSENLTVGDIQILRDDELFFVIERKTASDYVASIRDKRLKNQMARTAKLKTEHPHAIMVILVEGSFQPQFGQPVQISDFIYNSILNRILTDHIPVIRSDNVTETVLWIKKLMHKLEHDMELVADTDARKTEGSGPDSSSVHYLSTISVKKGDNLNSENCFILQLSQIPGVSIIIARAIAEQYSSWPKLIIAYSELTDLKKRELLLADINLGRRRLGPALSRKIYGLVWGGGTQVPP